MREAQIDEVKNVQKNDKVNEIKKSKKVNKTKEKSFKILNFSIWRLLAYFIIYSVVGFVIETVFGMMTKGVIESRQSFLYGPFCGIYGMGAVVMILALQYFNQNNNRLFLGGFIVGSIVEYIVSLYGDIFLNVKWWDYSNMPLNINGRICVFFSIFWGLLGIYLMSYVNPKVDKFIDWIKTKISIKKLKIATTLVIIFLFIDCVLTAYAIDAFVARKVHDYDIPIINKEQIEANYNKMYQNEILVKIINKYWNDEKMIKTLPNLKAQGIDGNMIYFDCYVGDIRPYYYKFNSKWRGDLVKILKQDREEQENMKEGI